MPKTELSTFCLEIAGFLKRHEISATDLGTRSLRDGNFVHDVRNGLRSPTLRTIERVRRYMRDYDARATS
jgi:hypothetical protein